MSGFAGFIGEKNDYVRKSIKQGLKESLVGKLYQRNFDNAGFQAIAAAANEVFYPANKSKTINVAFMGSLSDAYLKRLGIVKENVNPISHIAKIYKTEGLTALRELSGSFCYVINDSVNDRIILGRGNEFSPDFWTIEVNKNVVFFTEFEIAQSLDGFELKLNPASLVEYLIFDSADTKREIYKNAASISTNTMKIFEPRKSYFLTAKPAAQTKISHAKKRLSGIEDFVFAQLENYQRFGEESAIILSEGCADVFLSIFLPAKVKRIIPFFDSFFLFPNSVADEIKHKTAQLKRFFGNILPEYDFTEVGINIQQGETLAPNKKDISQLLLEYVKSLPFPNSNLGWFKQHILLDNLSQLGIENYILADPLDDLLKEKTNERKKSSFFDAINSVFNFLGKEEKEIAKDVSAFYCSIFESMTIDNVTPSDQARKDAEIAKFAEILRDFKPFNRIFADVFLSKKVQHKLTQDFSKANKFADFSADEIGFDNCLPGFKFEQKFSAIRTLSREHNINYSLPLCQNLEPLEQIYSLGEISQNKTAWQEIVDIIGVKAIFSQNPWADYMGKIWVLRNTEETWLPLLNNPLVIELQLLTNETLSKILTEYKNRTFNGISALFNIVILELWLNQNY